MTSLARGSARPPLLQVRGLSKSYPGTRALSDVSLEIEAGEIHALVGENGAGKSTLIHLLDGLELADEGEIRIGGSPVRLRSPRASRLAGVSVVPQEVMVVPGLSVGQNVLLGQEGFFTRRGGLGAAAVVRADAALALAGSSSAATDRAGELTPAELRLCQVAQTLASPGRIVILDEPTAVLSEHDAERLLGRLEDLRGEGRAILYVSHRLGEVMRIADRVSVLRSGRLVGTYSAAEVSRTRLIELMARVDGTVRPSSRGASRPPRAAKSGGGLELHGLTAAGFADVSLAVERGEVLGVAGVQGSGHGQLLRALAGLAAPVAGGATFDGEALPLGSVAATYRRGVVYIPADRKNAAVLALRSVRENVVLGAASPTAGHGLRRRRLEREVARELVAALNVKPPSTSVAVGRLSGGNQQKVALARALHANAEVLLLEEPTQGVDVEAKAEIHALVRELADAGRAVVLASSEFEELLEHADRIAVMCEGRLVSVVSAAEASYENLLHQAIPQ